MGDEAPSEVLFRASKRRKVIRKPAHADIESDAHAADQVVTGPTLDAGSNGSSGVVLAKRKGGTGKSGISFSTSDARRAGDLEQTENRSLVVAGDEVASQNAANDRFVKPTGRVGPTDDRHMMAYIDSKLAEKGLPANISSTNPDSDRMNAHLMANDNDIEPMNETTTSAPAPSNPPPTTAGPRTVSHAQERSHRVYQRPTRRKAPPMRKEADVARDSMVEQIMGENQVPLYDQTATTGGEDNMEDVDDPDAAAADAFKAQLLADLEQNNRRRRPVGKAGATAAAGPKLGGSRSQRERMKAMEEAKGSSGKK